MGADPRDQSIQQEMNRLFGTFFDSSAVETGVPVRRWVPAMDLVEEGQEFVLRADLPGMDEQDVKIELDERVLTISGRPLRASRGSQGRLLPCRAGQRQLQPSLTLPEGVDPEASGELREGRPRGSDPKPEERKPRRVTITPGAPVIEGQQPAAEGPKSGGRPAA